MKVIILAGGLGTRLRSVVNKVPKPMALIGNKPFLEILLDYLLIQGCTEVILAVSYLHKKIINHFNNNYKTLKITYSVETNPLGTGGAILQALNFVEEDEDVFILNGDTFCKINYQAFYKHHSDNKSSLSIVVKKSKETTRYGTVKINSSGKITNFINNKANIQGYINCGIYLLKKKVFQHWDFPKSFSFEDELLYPFVNKLDILAYKTEEFFIDIGIPEDYIFLNKLFM